jgi:mannose-6-phosphate isomerase-like protein (cupin superfamily)
MSRMSTLVLACVLMTPVFSVFAEDATGAKLWTSADFKALEKMLIPRMDHTKGGSEQIINKSTHNALVFHREGSGEPEIHTKLADFMVVLSGEGQIQVGGKLTDPKTTATEEIRGKTLDGGTMYKIAQGDVLYVPANTPHRTHVAAGKELNVMVIKVVQPSSP